jgi:hypothetical protein
MSSGMLCHVTLVRTDVSEELTACIIRITRIGIRSVRRLLVTAYVVPSLPILATLMREALRFSGTSVLTRASRYKIPEDGIFNIYYGLT